MKWQFIIPMLVVPLFFPFRDNIPKSPLTAQSLDAYAVYSVLIPHITSVRQKKFLIAADTITYAHTKSRFPVEPENLVTKEEFDRRVAGAIPMDLPNILRGEPCVLPPKLEREAYLSAMVDYRRKNETSIPLERKLDLPKAYQLVSVTSANRSDRTDDADAKRAGGLFELSAVGFSADATIAIVYAGFDCPLCGRWALYILKKIDGKWKLVASGCGWMS